MALFQPQRPHPRTGWPTSCPLLAGAQALLSLLAFGRDSSLNVLNFTCYLFTHDLSQKSEKRSLFNETN